MRAVLLSLFFLLVCNGVPCLASESVLANKEIESAVSLPPQEDQPGLLDMLWELRAERGDNTLLVLTHFPQGLGQKVDAALAEAAKQDNWDGFTYLQEQSDFSLEQYLERLSASAEKGPDKSLPERSPRDWSNTFVYVSTWQVFRPSDSFASVVFKHHMSGGAAHNNWTYRCVTFHLNSGSILEFSDFFPDEESGRKALNLRVLQALREKKQAAGQTSPLDEESIDVVPQRLALTAEGMRVYYAPYEAGSFSEGEYLIDIPKAELLPMGAAPDLWQ